MEKKRKRASFSSTMPEEIKKIEPKPSEERESPQPRQVVEVVVEQTSSSSKPAPQINIVIPPPEVRPDPTPEKVVEPPSEEPFEESVRIKEPEAPIHKIEELVENPEPEAIVTPDVKEVELEEEQEDDDDEPLEAVADYSQKSSPPFSTVPHHSEEKARAEAAEEKQKETVAELFGKNSQSVMPEITVHKSATNRGLLLWGITMVAVAIGVGGGLVLFTTRSTAPTQSPVSTSPTNIPTQAPQSSPTPTVVAIERSSIKVQVLNGGGKVGAGTKAKGVLEDKGYKVTDVGNASSYTFDQTEINVKLSKSAIRDVLEQDLTTASYTVGKVQATLPETSLYDAVVTVGKE